MAIEGAAARPQANDDERDTAALASLLDPAALERRLAQARQQRAAALAARKAASDSVPVPPCPGPSSEAPRRPVPLPSRAQRKSPETVLPSDSVAPGPAVPAVTRVPPPIELPPLIAERRLPPPNRRRALPAGVLIGFAAGAVAALGAVVILEPRLDLPTWTGAAPAETPAAASSPSETAPPVTFAEIVVVPPAPEASAGPDPAMPIRTPAEVRPAFVAAPPTALGSMEQAMVTAIRHPDPQRERLASAAAADPAPLAPEAGGDTTPPVPSGAAAGPPAAQVEITAPTAAGLAESVAPTRDDTPATPFADRDLRLIVHAPTGIPGADAEAALTLLSDAVAPPEGPIPVTVAISSSNVRYYHAADADAAAAAAASLSDRLGPVEARDFTGYRPSPAPGTIEVWLSGTPVSPARSTPIGTASSDGDRQAATSIVPEGEPRTVINGVPDLVRSVVQDQPVVQGIPNLVQSVVQNQATQSANAARAAAQAEESARGLDGGLGNALRRAFGAP